ncbi:hypothetical protein VKT23_011241 [Stygiomarasmius scandens]|uniref:Methylosome subunit pICln n=1 Tax=Marasmiellus scandens TaxID=2682957 RepID=A0ABR1JBH6_9AGAR
MLTLVSSVPAFVSPTEHTSIVSTTPTSFNDIPPVLRLKQENVRVSFDPPLQNLPDEAGTLYIIDTVLVFFTASGHGFQLEYPSITLHAISRDPPSIYCQLLSEEQPAVQHQNEEDENGNENQDQAMRELNIIPADPSALESIFESLSYCASLHPDPPSSEYDDEDDDQDQFADADTNGVNGFDTFDGTEQEELSAVGRAALEHLESIIVYPEGVQKPKDDDDEEEKKDAQS